MALRLRQAQIWKHADGFIRIVKLDRLEVRYMTFKHVEVGVGKHHLATKKEFCRLLKSCTLHDPKAAGDPAASPTVPAGRISQPTKTTPAPSQNPTSPKPE